MTSQKRISAPKTYSIKRKENVWVTSVKPGPHDKNSLPLVFILKDLIKVCRNSREVKKVLNKGEVTIDGSIRYDSRFPVSFMDSLSISSINKHYRVIYDHIGRLKCISINSKESGLKLVRIANKIRQAKEYQLVTDDGRSIMVKLTEGKKYKTSDSLLINIPSQDIVKHLEFKEGASLFIIGGKHVGESGVIKSIKDKEVVAKIKDNDHIINKRYVFITGDKKEELKLSE